MIAFVHQEVIGMKTARKKRKMIEILAYIHFNPLYRAVRRMKKTSRLRAAVLS